MNSNDFQDFSELWVATNEMSANGKVLSPRAMEMVFAALQKYPFELVQQALETHIASNQFAPTVAGIIEIITKGTGGNRPTADEAWNDLPKNEDYPCVWTEEMSEAWGLVANNYYEGDKIGSRMGFKACYERLCEEAKLFGKPVKWSFSHGLKKDTYQVVIDRAVAQGRLSTQRASEVMQALPVPATGAIAGYLSGKTVDTKGLSDVGRSCLTEIMKSFDERDAQIELERKQAREDEIKRRDKMINEAMMELPPEQQLALRNANLERYGNEVLH